MPLFNEYPEMRNISYVEKENRIDRAFKIGNQIRKIASTNYMNLEDFREIKCALAQDTHDLIKLIREYEIEVWKGE